MTEDELDPRNRVRNTDEPERTDQSENLLNNDQRCLNDDDQENLPMNEKTNVTEKDAQIVPDHPTLKDSALT